MKNIAFLLLFFTAIAPAQIVNIPDANFKTPLLNFPIVDSNGDGIADTDVDTNNDGQIQVSEAQAVTALELNTPLADLTGIEAFTNMTRFRILNSSLTAIDFNLMPQLTSLEISRNNSLTSIDFSPLVHLTTLVCDDNADLLSVNLNGVSNLVSTKITYNKISSLNISNLTQLETLNCEYNQLTAITLAGNPSLKNFNCSSNQMTSLDVTPAPNLQLLNCGRNSINTINFAGLLQLQEFICAANHLSSLDVTGLPSLTRLECWANDLTTLNVAGISSLRTLDFSANMVSNIDLSGLGNLNKLGCKNNLLPAIDLGPTPLLNSLNCEGNSFTSLNINMLPLLTELSFGNSGITTVDLSPQTALQKLTVTNSSINSIDLSAQTQLSEFTCSYNNNLAALDISHNTLLTRLELAGLPISTIDLSLQPLLTKIDFSSIALTTLDLSRNPLLDDIMVINLPNLVSIFMKNGDLRDWMAPNLFNCPNLRYICEDERSMATTYALNAFNNLSSQLEVNSYCSFNPGGDYNTITGNLRYDFNNNGCDAADYTNRYIKVRINDGAQSGSTYTHSSGDYTFYTQAGNFTLTPEVENPTYYNFSPPSAVVNFPAVDNSVQTQDFCITPNGIHPDLEVTLFPIDNAQPGYAAHYKIIYKNKGNQALSGDVTLEYDSNKLDFADTFPNDNFELNVNNIRWFYNNLQPFETREISLTLNVLAPPTVNDGDHLDFLTTINPVVADETPLDNVFGYDQLVINSFDPNQIECLEGNTIAPEEVGKYLHYNINFENVGTADAINVVVKSTIDPAKFNVGSLQLQYASHEVDAKVTGNTVEFIFKNIYLPPSNGPIGGHGNVLFKVKTLPNLVVGDEILGSASIFFDYNAPVATNQAETVIAVMSNAGFTKDNTIRIAPNPAKDQVSVSALSTIQSIQLFDAQGRILQTVMEHKKSSTLDISGKASGVYFIKVTTESGADIQKIMKGN